MHGQRRRKKRHTHGLKTVDITRGKNGYGFTISGQQPCILSCIVTGSPADRAGLKTGDYLISVNALNVSTASHDDVVSLIGSSTGLLTLQIAENCNDSDSSDEEYQNKPKSKYPNRARLRGQIRDKDIGRPAKTSGGKYPMPSRSTGQLRTRALSPENTRSREIAVFGPPQPRSRSANRADARDRLQGNENLDPLSVAVYPRKHKVNGQPLLGSGEGVHQIARLTQHLSKQASVTRDLRMGRVQPYPDEHTPIDRPVLHPHQQQQQHSSYGRMTPIDLSNILYPSIQPQYHEMVTPQEDDFFSDDNSDPCLRVVVGYIGSIEMPRDANLPSARLQSIRSAVRRLRVEKRIHTLVMMDVYIGGIRLTNTMGSTVAHYPGEKVAFSGVCPDDKRFFGIVTLHSASSDEISSDTSSPHDDWAGSSSCHVFMVDPELRGHNTHAHKARSFGIQCTIDPQTQRCMEFPKSPAPILRSVAKLYRERAGVLRGAPGGNHPRSSSNTSSNSDSGLGIGGGGSGGREEPDRVYVVEMGNSVSSTSSTSFRWESTEEKSAFYTPPSSMHQSSGSDLSHLRFPSSNVSGVSSGINGGVMHPNSSVSSTDSYIDRLNLRAMPDPKGFMSSMSSNTSVEKSHDDLDTQNSAENIRRKMHKVMSSRQRQLENDDKHRPPSCPVEQVVSGSDGDSLRSSESSQNPNPTVRAFHERQVSAPADTSMPTNHLAPPALPPKSTLTNGTTYSLTGSAPLNVSNHSVSERMSSIIPVPGPIPQPAIAGNGDKLSPRVFAGFNLGLGVPKKNPVPVSIPSVPAPGLIKDQDGFLRPKTPASVKPPVPERKPINSRANQRTPVALPKHSHYDRPKSTPPTLNPNARQNHYPGGEDTEYDSDPGNLGNLSSMSATMSLETTLAGANVSNLSVTGLGEQWAVTGDQWGKPMVDIETPKEKRRFSEGFSLFHKKKDEHEDSTTGGGGNGGGIGAFIEKKKLTKTGSFKYLRPKRNRPTISSSHESLVVSEAEFGTKKQALESARSVVSITGQNGTVPNGTVPHQDEGRRAASWALSFDKMLSDPAGLATFTVFLEKEYSQENIEFWSKCEDYKKISDAQQRKMVAKDLFDKHLSSNGSEAVNVDSHARQVTQAGLEAAAPDLFHEAQTQISQLMKTDSYQRFLKSDLYTKECVTAELEGRPLPYGPKPQPNEKVYFVESPQLADSLSEKTWKALKKSSSTSSTSSVVTEDKRRKSLINKMPAPWNRKLEKNRIMSKITTDPDLQKFRKIDGEIMQKITSIGSSRRSSLDLADLNYMSKEVTAAKEEKKKDESSDSLNSKESHKFCRVILPDNSTTVIPAKSGLTVRSSLQKLCERRHISLAAIDVFQVGSDKPLDLGKDISSLASKEIRLEHRILFRLDLPNRKPIGVKAKPGKSVKDVFKPILNKYGCKIDNMVVHMAGTGVVIDIESSVDTLENQRIAVQNSDEFAAQKPQKESQKGSSAKWGGFGSHRSVFGKPPIPKGGRPSLVSNSGDGVDDATNQMLRELIDGDGAQQFDELGILDPEKKTEEKGKSEEHRNSGIFGFIRRNSVGEKEKNKNKHRFPSQKGNNATASTNANQGRPAVPKRNISKEKDEDQFFALLSKVQSHNLDDQRGVMSSKNLELPDFLKPNHNSPQKDFRGRTHLRRNSESSVMDMMSEDHRVPRPASSDKVVDNPADRTLNPVDQSFSQDGIMPSHGDAENFFANARNFPGSPNVSINWRESGIGLRDPFSIDGATTENFKSNTPITKLPYRLSPRAKTPTPQQESSTRPMDYTTTESTKPRPSTTITGERATVVISRLSRQSRSEKEPLPPPPKSVTKDLMHVGMANFAPPTPIGHQSRSPGRPSVAQQILGANRAVHRSRDSPRSESVPPSNRVSLHRSEARIQVVASNTSKSRFNDSSISSSSSSYYHSQNSTGHSHQSHSGILSNSHEVYRNDRMNDSKHFNHVRFNDHTQTQSYAVSGADEETPMITSPASTPSPTTHDLIIDTSPDTTEGGRRLAPRAAKRTVGSPSFSQSDEVKKALSFDAASEANNSDNDMQVSYV